MPNRVRSFSVACVIGLMCLVLPASVTEAQNLLPGFEIAAGVQYGMQDTERPATPGWIVSSAVDVGGRSLVIEGTWHRESYVDGVLVDPCLNVPYPEFDEERAGGFVVQPGAGVDVNIRPRLALRLAADLPIIAGRDYVIFRPKFSASVVVAFGQ